MICEPCVSRMRFTARAVDDGCTKLTVSPLPTLKLCHWSLASWLVWLMVVVLWPVLPVWLMVASPLTTCPPVGAAKAPAAIALATSKTVVCGE